MLMGLAMIAILLFHQEFIKGNPILDLFNHFGHWGVQIFLFVSGFGIYYALTKSCECIPFYWRRIIRIMPAAIVGGILSCILAKESSLFQNLLMLSGLSLWYVRTILFLYLLSPILFRFFSGKKRTLLYCGLMLCSFALLHFADATMEYWWMGSWNLRQTVLWTLGAVPYFVSGMYLASSSAEKSLQSFMLILVLQVCTPVIFNLAFSSVISWNGMIQPFAVLMICAATVILVKLPLFLARPIEWCGTHSLELYVCHEAIYAYLYKLKATAYMLPVALLASFVCAWIISILSKIVTDRWLSRVKIG